MKCPYCDTEFEMETLRAYDESLREDGHDDIHWETSGGTEWRAGEEEGMRVYSCRSCGGEIVCDENTAATSCPYCGNPVVMTGNLSGALRPDLVIPFKLDKKAAKAGLEKHLANKYFLPAVFRSQNHIDEIKGVYVPVWLFDADVSGKLPLSRNADQNMERLRLHLYRNEPFCRFARRKRVVRLGSGRRLERYAG